MNAFSRLAGLAALLLTLCAADETSAAGSAGPTKIAPLSIQSAAVAPAATSLTRAGAHALTAEDVGAYFDGLLPDAISRADIAGAIVVVVRDGQPLFERGYGLSDIKAGRAVDPETTLFRPGSISKTFTWTAVMQQVEAGKIDLDADINQYLDFKIPPYDGKPITMRQLMTHSAGFSDAAKDLISTDPKQLKSLGDLLKGAVPARIYPPGTTPAYSNYGASLAGYIVERVSGEKFADYVARHIFVPLGMTHSSFAQPLPPALAANMAKGYPVASQPSGPYELIGMSPAGALAATGSDMSRFMIAHLQDGEFNGQRILSAKTAQLMHSEQFRPVPMLPAMALGFYQEPGNGHRVIGHAGDTNHFHSDMHLYLDDHVGLFISFNSAGAGGAAHSIRTSVFKGFTDRYFPAVTAPEAPTWKSARADASTLSGFYVDTRRSDSGWFRIANFLIGQTKITADKDGVLTISSFRGLNGKPKHWREIGPFQYKEVGGDSRVAAVVSNGKPVLIMSDDLPPALGLQPVSGLMSAAWNLPLFYVTIGILAIAALTWPLAAFIRWRYGHAFELTGRSAVLYRLTRAVALTFVVFGGLWLWLLSAGLKDLAALSSSKDWVFRIIQIVGLVGIVGSVAPLMNVGAVFGDPSRGWWAKVSSVSIAFACLAVIWFALSLHLITPKIVY